jgi:hypothetical protein
MVRTGALRAVKIGGRGVRRAIWLVGVPEVVEVTARMDELSGGNMPGYGTANCLTRSPGRRHGT